MAQPKKPPLSIRLPADVLAKVDIWAARRGIKRNAAVVEMLQAAQPAKPLPSAKEVGRVGGAAIRVAVPTAKVIAGFDLQIGPPRSEPGSRLKKRP